MRSTRKNKRKNSSNKVTNIIIFFVIAPILAITITVGLFKYLILPQVLPDKETSTVEENVDSNDQENNENSNDSNGENSNSNEDSNEESTSNTVLTFNLPGMNLYNVQIGSFSERKNAESLVEQLRKNGIDGYIIEKESYKVFVGTFFSREDADVYLVKVREFYKEAFIKKFDINGSIVQYIEKDQEYKEILSGLVNDLNNDFSEESILWTNAIKNSDSSSIKGVMINNNTELENKLNSINGNLQSDELIKLIDDIKKQLEQRKDIVNNIEINNIESISSAYKKFNTTLFKYMKIITQQE